MKASIKGHKGIVKDMESGAILACNLQEVEDYKAKKAALSAKTLMVSTEERINKLETDISEIKELLIKALK